MFLADAEISPSAHSAAKIIDVPIPGAAEILGKCIELKMNRDEDAAASLETAAVDATAKIVDPPAA